MTRKPRSCVALVNMNQSLLPPGADYFYRVQLRLQQAHDLPGNLVVRQLRERIVSFNATLAQSRRTLQKGIGMQQRQGYVNQNIASSALADVRRERNLFNQRPGIAGRYFLLQPTYQPSLYVALNQMNGACNSRNRMIGRPYPKQLPSSGRHRSDPGQMLQQSFQL